MNFPDQVRAFWLEATEFDTSHVHGYSAGDRNCPKRGGSCFTVTRYITHGPRPLASPEVPGDMEPRCEHCGELIPDVRWSRGVSGLYRLPDVKSWAEEWPAGTMIPLRLAPVGAMWDAVWLKRDDGGDFGYTGPDGIALCVKLPNGWDWLVDAQASNCDRDQHTGEGGRFVRSHSCWVRRGDPRSGWVHVTKGDVPDDTCKAGAGSIWVDKDGPRDWHGFLHDGILKKC